MKRIVLLLSFIITVSYCWAQEGDTAIKPLPPKPIPHYRILTTDSVWITPDNLKKGKAVMIVYFSPDCTHCQRMMYELKPKLDALKNIQVVMVTFSRNYDIRGIREFKRDYDLKKYPNIVLGTEGYTMLVQQYYAIRTTPFIAFYKSNGQWAKYIDKVPKTEDILSAAKML
jgi:thioredoxin-related protein